VASASGGASGVVATFAANIQPEAADYAGSVVVTLGGSPIAGATAETSDGVLSWTPAATLAAGSYSVTVFHVKSDLGGDSVSMQAPSTFTFNVP
jgi:hypothetical protein